MARFLNLSLNMFQCFNIKLTGLKRKYEVEEEIEIYNRVNKNKKKFERNENLKLHEEENKNDE